MKNFVKQTMILTICMNMLLMLTTVGQVGAYQVTLSLYNQGFDINAFYNDGDFDPEAAIVNADSSSLLVIVGDPANVEDVWEIPEIPNPFQLAEAGSDFHFEVFQPFRFPDRFDGLFSTTVDDPVLLVLDNLSMNDVEFYDDGKLSDDRIDLIPYTAELPELYFEMDYRDKLYVTLADSTKLEISHLVRNQNFEVEGYVGPPIPEPGTIVLLGLGLVGMIGIMRRKKQRYVYRSFGFILMFLGMFSLTTYAADYNVTRDGSNIIDEESAYFTKTCKSGGPWWWYAPGYNGQMTYTNAMTNAEDCSGYWWLNIIDAGNYEIFAYIPAQYATSQRMKYEIRRGAYTTAWAPLDQSRYFNEWISLGTYAFNAGQASIRVGDWTGEPYANPPTSNTNKKIAYDAIKLVYKSTTPGTPDPGTPAEEPECPRCIKKWKEQAPVGCNPIEVNEDNEYSYSIGKDFEVFIKKWESLKDKVEKGLNSSSLPGVSPDCNVRFLSLDRIGVTATKSEICCPEDVECVKEKKKFSGDIKGSLFSISCDFPLPYVSLPLLNGINFHIGGNLGVSGGIYGETTCNDFDVCGTLDPRGEVEASLPFIAGSRSIFAIDPGIKGGISGNGKICYQQDGGLGARFKPKADVRFFVKAEALAGWVNEEWSWKLWRGNRSLPP